MAVSGWAAPVASAEFGPIDLVSKSAREQADFAVEPALSANGRYLAFCGSIGGLKGVFREELAEDTVEPVLVEPVGSSPKAGVCATEASYAEAPSISADGRYVSFATVASLDSSRDPVAGSRDVYVADMSTAPPSYDLASATDGREATALAGGSLAAGRVALSASGRRVAFVNQGEVYVRDLDSGETTLISAKRNAVGGTMASEPVPGGGAFEAAGAAISGDGSTVAWVGEHLPEQVPLLGDEETLIRKIEAGPRDGLQNQYHEPLWRRVPTEADDPPTRRVVGGGDPLAPGCPGGSGTLAEPACEGPYPDVAKGRELESTGLNTGVGWGLGLPQLDYDGYTAALVANPDEQNDLFVVDMRPGLDRREAVRQLTQWTNPVLGNPGGPPFANQKYWPFLGPIGEFAISADGTRIAFATTRQDFPLAPPTLISPQPAAVSLLAELYQVDLAGETIERATPGPGGDVSLGEGQAGAAAPSYDESGRLLAFSDGAHNLVSGDANEASDAFLVESPPSPPARPSQISPPPAALVLRPRWRLSARAVSEPDGSVMVVASVPGSGKLRALAQAQVGARPRPRHVASSGKRAPGEGVLRLALRLPRRLRPLARRQGGLVGTVRVAFAGPGGKPLHATLDARFRAGEKEPTGGGRR